MGLADAFYKGSPAGELSRQRLPLGEGAPVRTLGRMREELAPICVQWRRNGIGFTLIRPRVARPGYDKTE